MARTARRVWTVVHRFVGLAIAGFLFVAGITGALISWDHELDEWLNSHLYEAPGRGTLRDPYEMAEALERANPHASVFRIPLLLEEGRSALFLVSPAIDPITKKPFELGYNEIYLDPVSGAELGRRDAGKIAFDREHALAFLYRFHYSLHLPEMWGIDRWGQWLMGGVAMLWFFDCFVGFYLTLPKKRTHGAENSTRMEGKSQEQATSSWWRSWRRAWMIRGRQGTYRRIFDLHRAGGLWVWIFLATLALSGATLNLFPEIFRPLLLSFSQYTPSANDIYVERPPNERVVPRLSFEEAAAIAENEARIRGWEEPINRIFYAQRSGYYTASFFRHGDYLAVNGMPHRRLYIDGEDGRIVSFREPWKGSGADIFRQVQFPLHSGRILGLPGRILISVMGLVVTVLSITGVVIWWRKRNARATAAVRGRA
ncbi:MAG: PepSY domain-containing protein [Burkholderiales bacterium]|nr:PepSY domain-containing protein [Burkholderiales bacterium]